MSSRLRQRLPLLPSPAPVRKLRQARRETPRTGPSTACAGARTAGALPVTRSARVGAASPGLTTCAARPCSSCPLSSLTASAAATAVTATAAAMATATATTDPVRLSLPTASFHCNCSADTSLTGCKVKAAFTAALCLSSCGSVSAALHHSQRRVALARPRCGLNSAAKPPHVKVLHQPLAWTALASIALTTVWLRRTITD